MALDIKKFIGRFVEEAKEHLGRLASGLAEIEQGAVSAEKINSLFRSVHTLKGSSRMLKLEPITQVSHSLEDLLSALREERVTVNPPVIALLYQGVDALSDQVQQLIEHGQVDALSSVNAQLCQQLTAIAEGDVLNVVAVESAELKSSELKTQGSSSASAQPTLTASDTVRVKLDKLDELIKLMGELVSSHAGMRELAVTSLQLEQQLQQQLQGHLPVAMQQFSRNMRDIVLSQESLMQELHDKTLQMRMLPLAIVLDPAARLVRDMARSLGKQVECRIYGSEIELDRQMIDQLADPIIHLLRNALDHGIETPDIRQQKGKPVQGLLQISARQDGGWVVLEVRDDGQGLSLATIRDKALKKGLVSSEQLAEMSEQQVSDLIFEPGFSTSNIITEFSGRGVGMDVVKRSIVDDLQGVISLHTRIDKGTCFTLRLPLSLAMMRVLLIRAGEQVLGFTAQYVTELISVAPSALISVADRNAVIIRNEFVPVIQLVDLLKLPQASAPKRSLSRTRSDLLLLVIRVHNEKLALIVDELLDERDLVIKQLPEHLRSNPLISGMVTIGHNELVSLIHVPYVLDIARKARQPANRRAQTDQEKPKKRILVVDDSLNTREIERDVLEAWGYHVTLAEHGQEGLDKALAEQFDAVLTDVEMPIMDGFTLTARLREHERYQECPIIIITSREKESDRRRGIEVGADAYIVKGSFDQNSLVDTLKVLLD
ncbi:hybrid sensor histidine kinase/response regulator [Denitrificimonas caeni]|uniref:hybrid sensor histidine kinase/response regulator n=1 Tax=Denitrificimonas caeni TaxID=521720 RepID=UPI0003B63A54|nr:hybrid sensor histidine kinase/response regulator [Denitrificimonas caeni]